MAEEKEKNKNKKKTETNSKNVKTSNSKKTTSTSKSSSKTKKVEKAAPASKTTSTKKTKTTSTAKKTTPKKVTEQPKKTAPKKAETQKKETTPKVVEKKEISNNEKLLEKTLIFDGRQNQNLAEVVEKLEEKNVVLEDKVIKRSKVKKVIIVILTLLIIAIIVATTIYVVRDELDKPKHNETAQTLNSNVYKKVVDNYETIGSINGDNNSNENKDEESVSIQDIQYENIETITLAEFEQKILDKENITVLISSTTCYACITYEPTISTVYKSLDKTIYRLNITAMKQEEIDRFRTYYRFTVTPTIFTIKDGYVASETTGQMLQEELAIWASENS